MEGLNDCPSRERNRVVVALSLAPGDVRPYAGLFMTTLIRRRGRPPLGTNPQTATERSRKRYAKAREKLAASLGAPADLPEIPWNEHCGEAAFKPVYLALVAMVEGLRRDVVRLRYGLRGDADVNRGGVANV